MGKLYCKKAPSIGWDVKPRSWLSVVITNPMALLVKSKGVTLVSWPNSPIGLWPLWPLNHPHTMIGFITLSPLHQEAGGHSGALWLPSHHPGGCCTLVVDEEIPPLKHFECLETCYINVTNTTLWKPSYIFFQDSLMKRKINKQQHLNIYFL